MSVLNCWLPPWCTAALCLKMSAFGASEYIEAFKLPLLFPAWEIPLKTPVMSGPVLGR